MYTIHPIQCGTLDSLKGNYTYLLDQCEEMRISVLSFLITADDPADDTVIVVDTGLEATDGTGRKKGGGPDPLLAGLADHGVSPEEVDFVILSHLHHDHTSNNLLFEGSEFLVQREELAAARDPLPAMRGAYDDANTATLDDLDVTLVDGGYRLREGIELLLTPGHSRGLQSVLVETANGPYALISDLAYCRHNLDPSVTSIVDAAGRTIETTPSDADYVPPGIHVDLGACYSSIARIRECVPDGHLLAGHDYDIVGESFP
jgi:N-acyl homoserine lactone hydrolase